MMTVTAIETCQQCIACDKYNFESRVCCFLFPEVFIRHQKTASQFLDCVAVNVINEVSHLPKYKVTLLQS